METRNTFHCTSSVRFSVSDSVTGSRCASHYVTYRDSTFILKDLRVVNLLSTYQGLFIAIGSGPVASSPTNDSALPAQYRNILLSEIQIPSISHAAKE